MSYWVRYVCFLFSPWNSLGISWSRASSSSFWGVQKQPLDGLLEHCRWSRVGHLATRDLQSGVRLRSSSCPLKSPNVGWSCLRPWTDKFLQPAQLGSGAPFAGASILPAWFWFFPVFPPRISLTTGIWSCSTAKRCTGKVNSQNSVWSEKQNKNWARKSWQCLRIHRFCANIIDGEETHDQNYLMIEWASRWLIFYLQ